MPIIASSWKLFFLSVFFFFVSFFPPSSKLLLWRNQPGSLRHFVQPYILRGWSHAVGFLAFKLINISPCHYYYYYYYWSPHFCICHFRIILHSDLIFFFFTFICHQRKWMRGFQHNCTLMISLRGKMDIWPHTLYAYSEEAHWYVMAVPLSSPFWGTAHTVHFFSYFVWLWISSDLTAITLRSVTQHNMFSRGHSEVMSLQTG